MGTLRKKPRNTRILEEDGPPCPRCGNPTEIREHIKISGRERKRPFYYSRWYNCVNWDCKTNLIMPDKFRVYKSKRTERVFSEFNSSFFMKQKGKQRDISIENTQNIDEEQLKRLDAIKEQLKPPWE